MIDLSNMEAVKKGLPNLTLNEIAVVIQNNWGKVYFEAVPYLNAMRSLNSIKDNYGQDSAVSIVAYFLGNAQTWRGDVARLVKAELNKRVRASQ